MTKCDRLKGVYTMINVNTDKDNARQEEDDDLYLSRCVVWTDILDELMEETRREISGGKCTARKREKTSL